MMVTSTLLGPILAVQAQKWVERARAASQRREWIFTTLMATRQARVSLEHVRALNMIDLAYYGTRVPILGFVWRPKRNADVVTAWREYYSHLTPPEPGRRPQTEAEQRDWIGRGDELFINLLDRLAISNKFQFDRAQLKSGDYSPEAHGIVECEQQSMRRLAIEVLSGRQPLPMELKAWLVGPQLALEQRNTQAEIIENQRELLTRLADVLDRLVDRTTEPRDGAHTLQARE